LAGGEVLPELYRWGFRHFKYQVACLDGWVIVTWSHMLLESITNFSIKCIVRGWSLRQEVWC